MCGHRSRRRTSHCKGVRYSYHLILGSAIRAAQCELLSGAPFEVSEFVRSLALHEGFMLPLPHGDLAYEASALVSHSFHIRVLCSAAIP